MFLHFRCFSFGKKIRSPRIITEVCVFGLLSMLNELEDQKDRCNALKWSSFKYLYTFGVLVLEEKSVYYGIIWLFVYTLKENDIILYSSVGKLI